MMALAAAEMTAMLRKVLVVAFFKCQTQYFRRRPAYPYNVRIFTDQLFCGRLTLGRHDVFGEGQG